MLLIGLASACNQVQPISLATCGAYQILKSTPPKSFTSCLEFPEIAEAQKVLQENQQFIQKLKTENPGFLLVDVRKIQYCTSKAVILVEYAGEQDCPSIKRAIGETFFGVPYILTNG